MDMPRPADIPLAPSPWTCKATIYVVAFWQRKAVAAAVAAEKLYSPLEASSPAFAAPSEAAGEPVGGIGSIQLLRYSDTPVGPYDELIIAPGDFTYHVAGTDGKRVTRKAMRITRIYVSQRPTAWNGRYNWNIPKHLARFEWDERADGSTHVKVFPHDTSTTPYDAAESSPGPADKPFFQCTFRPVPYLPYFPFSTRLLDGIGMGITFVQPPLPAGPRAAGGELVGTSRWVRCRPVEAASRTCLGWFDLRQGRGPDQSQGTGRKEDEGGENFWPGVGRWVLGAQLRDALVEFHTLETWEPVDFGPEAGG